MKTILYRVTRLLHPLTLAVILIGVFFFMLGLIVAVEKQDATVDVPQVDVGQADRIARLETALADRESELAALQGELIKLRADAPSPAAIANAEGRIASLEAALKDTVAEQTALQDELNQLAGQLAEAIQSRDDLRTQTERDRLANESTRAGLDQTIADLRRELKAAQERVRAPEPVAPTPVEAAPTETPVDETPAAAATASAPEPTAPTEPPSTEPEKPDQQSAAAPVTGGPIARGIAAYRAEDYRQAYELWLQPALRGSARAQFYVGALYFEGRGVPADRVTSYMWLRSATKKDDPGAVKLLDRLREDMTGAELAEAETRIANGETIPSQ